MPPAPLLPAGFVFHLSTTGVVWVRACVGVDVCVGVLFILIASGSRDGVCASFPTVVTDAIAIVASMIQIAMCTTNRFSTVTMVCSSRLCSQRTCFLVYLNL
jgi:hypothetical protein